MATVSDNDLWRVFLDCQDESKAKMYRLPCTTSMNDLKLTWSRDAGVCPDSFEVVNMDGETVGDKVSLQEVGEIQPGKKVVNLSVREADLCHVFIDAEDEAHARMFRVPGGALLEEVRSRWALEVGESPAAAELLTLDGSVAGASARLRDLAERQSGRLVVNLAADRAVPLRLALLGAARRPRPLLVRLSQSPEGLGPQVRAILRLPAGRPLPLRAGDRVLRADEGLGAQGIRPHCLLLADLGRPVKAALLTGPSLRPRILAPTRQVRDVTSGAAAVGGRFLARCALLGDLDLPEGSLLHRPVAVTVALGGGKHRVVRVPAAGAVRDLHEALHGPGGGEAIALRRQGRELDPDEALGDAGIADGDCVEAQGGGSLTLTLRERVVTLSGRRDRWRFSELMAAAAARSGIRYDRLLRRSLRCEGCSRRLTREEEAFQEVPALCCRVQSLRLVEPLPPARTVSGTQTFCPSSGRGGRKCRRRTQTSAHPPATKQSFTQQWPPPPEPPRLLIIDCTSTTGSNSSWQEVPCLLPLKDRVTVGEVKAVVADRLSVPSQRLQIQRWIGKNGREDIYHVCDRTGQFVDSFSDRAEFGSCRGRVWSGKDVVKRRLSGALKDNRANFVLVPGRLNYIIAL